MKLNTNRRLTTTRSMSAQGRRWAQALVLSVALGVSGHAMALPTPQDIQTSVQSGRLDQAESQLREVLRAKPNSAKAHYELGEVLAREGRYIEAQQSLREAQRLEPSLKFASSPQKFQDLLDKVNAKAAPVAAPSSAAVRAAVPAPMQPMPERAPAGLPWGIIALAVAGLVLLVVWMRRAAAANVMTPQATPVATPMGGTGYGAAYNRRRAMVPRLPPAVARRWLARLSVVWLVWPRVMPCPRLWRGIPTRRRPRPAARAMRTVTCRLMRPRRPPISAILTRVQARAGTTLTAVATLAADRTTGDPRP